MKCLVDLCNNNAGFVSAIGALATIVVAILIAWYPHRISLQFNSFLMPDPDDAATSGGYTAPFHLWLYNVGDVGFTILDITIKGQRKGVCGQHQCGFGEYLPPHENREFDMELYVPEHKRKKMCIRVRTNCKRFWFFEKTIKLYATWAVG